MKTKEWRKFDEEWKMKDCLKNWFSIILIIEFMLLLNVEDITAQV